MHCVGDCCCMSLCAEPNSTVSNSDNNKGYCCLTQLSRSNESKCHLTKLKEQITCLSQGGSISEAGEKGHSSDCKDESNA